MTNAELNTKLYEKIFDEQKDLKGWLLTQPPEEILNHAYEYVMREDIVLALEYHDLSDEQAKALLASPSPLAEIFHDFEKIEGDHMDTIKECIESRANKNIEAQREALRNLPVYVFSASFAKNMEKPKAIYENAWMSCYVQDEDDHTLSYDMNRPDDDTPVEDLRRFEVVFDFNDQRRYCYIDALSIDEALGQFFRFHHDVTYDCIVEHMEV